MDEGKFTEFMRAVAAQQEDAVLAQELSPDEMAGAAGGQHHNGCTQAHSRDIYEGGFPNCAHTVENGSWCDLTDACYAFSVTYYNAKDCSKAWK